MNQPIVMQPRDNIPPVVQPPPQVPQDDIGTNQMPPQLRQRVETLKREIGGSSTFQLPNFTPFSFTSNLGETK